MGSLDAARNELLAARTMQLDLLKSLPDDSKRLKALADTLNALGSLFKQTNSLDDAIAMYTEAVTLRTRLASLDPTNDEHQRLLANVYMNMGQVELGRNHISDARDHLLAAQDMRGKLLDSNPKARRDLAMGFYNLANASVADQRDEEAVKYYRAAIEQFEQLRQQDARSLANRFQIAVCYRQLGSLQLNANNAAAAILNFEIAKREMESLAIGNPDVLLYQTELTNLNLNVAGLYQDQGDFPKAQGAWSQVLVRAQELLLNDSDNAEYRGHEATALGALGRLKLQSNQEVAGAELLASARDRFHQMLKEFPNDQAVHGGFWEWQLEEIESQLGGIFAKNGDLPAARKALSEALALARSVRKKDPENIQVRIDEAKLLRALGNVLGRSGKIDAATKTIEEARDRFQELLAEFAGDEELKRELDDTLQDLNSLAANHESKE
jgi:tetratricopeptide (TPR) repeat protein